MRHVALTLALLILCVGPVAAKKDSDEIANVETGKSQFLKQAKQIRKDLARSDKYQELKQSDRGKVASALDRMEKTLEPVASFEELNDVQRTRLFNDQELVNALLVEAREDSRMVCRRVKRVGSHMSQAVCETVAERRRRIAAESSELERQLDIGRGSDNVSRAIREGGG